MPVDAPPPPFVDPPPPSLPAAATIITDTALLSTITPAFGTLPLAFVPNAGQTRDRRVQFQANYDGSTLLFSPDSVVLLLARRVPDVPGSGIGNGDSNDNSNGNGQGQAKQRNDDKGTVFLGDPVTFELDGANKSPQIRMAQPLPGVVNYYQGADPADWKEGVPTFSQLIYDDVYPGISVVYDGNAGTLKSTYVVAPGADPSAIRWRYRGLKDVQLQPDGSLHYSADLPHKLDDTKPVTGTAAAVVTTTVDPALAQPQAPAPPPQTITLIEDKPVAWQERDGERVPVGVSYELSNNGAARFVVEAYDSTLPLFLDPTLTFSTYIGILSIIAGAFGDSPAEVWYITQVCSSLTSIWKQSPTWPHARAWPSS